MALLLKGLFSLVLEGSMLSSGSPGISAWSTMACANLCFADTSCVAFFYNKYSGHCHLHTSQDLTSEELKPDSGMRFYILHKESCSTETQGCPTDTGYTLSTDPHLCYKIVSEKMDHQHAMSSCQNDGGFLIRIDSHQKKDFIHTLHEDMPWIDGSDENDDKWRFSDGTLMTYTYWSHSQHANDGNCISIRGRYSKWFKTDCNSKHMYICEIQTA